MVACGSSAYGEQGRDGGKGHRERGSGGTGMLDNGAGRTTGTGRSRNTPGRVYGLAGGLGLFCALSF